MTTNKGKSIKILIAGCRKGNKHDWTELIERLAPVVFSACYRFRLSREESYDVFGKVSLLVLENLNNLRDEERIYGYVSTISHREANALKTRSRIFTTGLSANDYESSDEAEDMLPLPRMELDEDLEIMSRAYSGLSHKCQELLRLLFLESEGISYKDISRRLGLPVSSIGPNRSRCLDKLRHNMIKEGYEE
jgi:RNA polymerase sigma factor (sigma-70 family)